MKYYKLSRIKYLTRFFRHNARKYKLHPISNTLFKSTLNLLRTNTNINMVNGKNIDEEINTIDDYNFSLINCNNSFVSAFYIKNN